MSQGISCTLEFSEERDILKIGFYTYTYIDNVYSNDKKAFKFTEDSGVGTMVDKQYLIGKDIVICRNKVKEINGEQTSGSYSSANVVCDQDLLLIIHGVDEDNFDENGFLVINVNHYKLK